MKARITEIFHSSEGTEIRVIIPDPIKTARHFHKTGVKAYGEWAKKAGLAQDSYEQEVKELKSLHLGEVEITQDGTTP